jgi:hypothetical protein
MRLMSGSSARARLCDPVVAGPGGVKTAAAGVVTGALLVATADLGNGAAQISAKTTHADKWYELEGSPTLIPTDGLAVLHQAALNAALAGGGAGAPRGRR